MKFNQELAAPPKPPGSNGVSEPIKKEKNESVAAIPPYPETFWSFKYALPFISKRAVNPPLGLLTVAAMLPDTREKRLVDMNVAESNPSTFLGEGENTTNNVF